MGHHLIDGEFKSDLHPDLPANKIVLSFKDPLAQPALWLLAEMYKDADPELAGDIQKALINKGFNRVLSFETAQGTIARLRQALEAIVKLSADRERFVLMGARAFQAAETIAKGALKGEPHGG
jgi:hypothetical protein